MISIKIRYTSNEDYNKVKAMRLQIIADNPNVFNDNSCSKIELIEV